MFTWNRKRYDSAKYVVNPATNRVIARDSRTGRKLISSGQHVEEVGGVPTLMAGHRVVNGQVTNPITGRMIEVGGRVYENLINAGWVHIGDGGMVQPERVSKLDLGSFQGPDLANSINVAVLAFVAENDGPFYVAIPGADGQMARIREAPTLARVMSTYRNLVDGDGYRAVLDHEYEQLGAGANPLAGVQLLAPLDGVAQAQFVAASSYDGLCVRRCFEQLFPEEDWSEIPDTCGHTEMEVIARSRRLDVRVFTAANLEEPLHRFRPKGTAGGVAGKAVNLLYQFNHTVVMPRGLKFAEDRDNARIVWYETDEALADALLAHAADVPVQPVVGGQDAVKLYGFATPTEIHKREYEGHEIESRAWTTSGAAFRRFKAAEGEPLIQDRLVSLRFGMVNMGLSYSRGLNGVAYKYDQRRAYASYAKCPHYSGFPDPAAPMELFDWDPRILETCEGLVLVENERPYPESVFEGRLLWAPFPQVRYALERGMEFTPLAVLACKRRDDPFLGVKGDFGDGSKSWFHQLIGRMQMHEVTPTVVATNVDELATLEGRGFRSLKHVDVGGRKVWMCVHRESRAKTPEHPYLAAYVHAYQKLTMHHDLLSRLSEASMGWSDVVRVWVDGVTLREPLPEGFLPSDRWHEVETERHDDFGWNLPLELPAVPRTEVPTCQFDPILVEPRVAALGAPGTGKTTWINEFWAANGRRLTLTASTHLAALNLGAEASTAQKAVALYRAAPEKFRQTVLANCDRLVVDEFTMLGPADLETILEFGVPVLLAGDFEQLCAVTGTVDYEWLADRGFVVREFTEIRRATDPQTEKLYHAARGREASAIVRACREAGVPQAKLEDVRLPEPGSRAHIVSSLNANVDALNRRYAAACAAKAPNAEVRWGRGDGAYSAPASVGMLVIATKTTKRAGGLRNQEIGFVRAIKGAALEVESCATGLRSEAAPADLKPGFALTYHRCQGQTFDFPLALDLRRLFDRRMLYVAVTRVRNLAHLTLVGDPPAGASEEPRPDEGSYAVTNGVTDGVTKNVEVGDLDAEMRALFAAGGTPTAPPSLSEEDRAMLQYLQELLGYE